MSASDDKAKEELRVAVKDRMVELGCDQKVAECIASLDGALLETINQLTKMDDKEQIRAGMSGIMELLIQNIGRIGMVATHYTNNKTVLEHMKTDVQERVGLTLKRWMDQ